MLDELFNPATMPPHPPLINKKNPSRKPHKVILFTENDLINLEIDFLIYIDKINEYTKENKSPKKISNKFIIKYITKDNIIKLMFLFNNLKNLLQKQIKTDTDDKIDDKIDEKIDEVNHIFINSTR